MHRSHIEVGLIDLYISFISLKRYSYNITVYQTFLAHRRF
jgi:hypothetical protein